MAIEDAEFTTNSASGCVAQATAALKRLQPVVKPGIAAIAAADPNHPTRRAGAAKDCAIVVAVS